MLRWLKILYLWRYWPKQVLYFPLTVYILLVESLRTGRLFYFAAANPDISLGGFAGDSKFKILQHVPDTLKPVTIFIKKDLSFEEAEREVRHLNFPLIAKPDLGEGGFKVSKLENVYDMIDYHLRNQMDYLIQTYCDYEHELTLLCYRKGNEFVISSVVERIPFYVKGDGNKTIFELIKASNAGFYNLKKIKQKYGERLKDVPLKGEVVGAGGIGNWDFGASYIERRQLNTPEVQKQFTRIMSEVGIFNYARIDFKCKHYLDIVKGDIVILEINGVKGEPVHLYDSKYSLFQAYKIIFSHWSIIRQLSLLNIKKGFICPNAFKGFRILFRHAWHKLG